MDEGGETMGLRLAELLAARLCHDLSSPLTGLAAGLESAEAGHVTEREALAHAADAYRAARGRLQLLRAAWGEAGEPMDTAGLARHAATLEDRRVRIDLAHLAPDAAFAPAAARLMLNVMMLGAESLPRGGTVMLQGDAASGVVVGIAGPQARWPAHLPGLIAVPGSAAALLEEVSPREVQAPLTVMLARAAGIRLSLLLGAAAQAAPPLLVAFSVH